MYTCVSSNVSTANDSANITEILKEAENNACISNHHYAFTQIVVIIVNLIHLAVLYQLKKRYNSIPVTILIIMSVNDVSVASFNVVRFYCLHQAIYSYRCLTLTLAELGFNLTIARYYIIAVACYDRFVAICTPYSYDGHQFLQNITLHLTMIFICTLVIGEPLRIACERCWIFACITTESSASIVRLVLSGYHGILMTLIALLTIISSVCVLRELYMMSNNRSRMPTPCTATLRLTHLVLITLLVFLLCLIPSAVMYFAAAYVTLDISGLVVRVSFDSYAIGNVIVYGAMSRNYRHLVTEAIGFILSRFRKESRVEPSIEPSDA